MYVDDVTEYSPEYNDRRESSSCSAKCSRHATMIDRRKVGKTFYATVSRFFSRASAIYVPFFFQDQLVIYAIF